MDSESFFWVRGKVEKGPRMVEMDGGSEMCIAATTHGNIRFDWPRLRDSMQALMESGADPAMVGGVGYADNVWPLRLWGEDS